MQRSLTCLDGYLNYFVADPIRELKTNFVTKYEIYCYCPEIVNRKVRTVHGLHNATKVQAQLTNALHASEVALGFGYYLKRL